ncbi:YqaJ viral recombinase family protein [Propionibacteriaceae bacterium Y1700]|uniref:YqaJ viral recombinase family protein n=1 Tax=Microlunatus sp. Y1700 TaxID=3418487 RepID=UPI003DA7294E
MTVEFLPLGDRSPEWHATRSTRIGGSDCGAIIGHGYVSRARLLAEKRGEVDRSGDTDAKARGRWLEPAGLAYLAEKKGVTYDAARQGSYWDDWRVYNPDAITTDGRLIEIKSTAQRDDRWGRGGKVIKPGDPICIPVGYYSQTQWGMELLGIKETLLAVVATKLSRRQDGSDGSDFDFASYRIKHDPTFCAWLLEQARAFHHDMTTTDRKAA